MRYFPDPVSGWVFISALAAVLALASYFDERYTKIPKWLTLPALVLGLVFSVARGWWLAAHGMNVWLFTEPGPLLGAFDGVLFALAGLVVGFFVFFGIWLLGGCGGGDVKLFAALGAWLGPYLVFCVLIVSLILLFVCLVSVLAWRGVGSRVKRDKDGKKVPVVVRFSLVAALAVLLVALWAFRTDLGLMRSRATGATAEVGNHAR